ncbi:trans-L-3-hydroxyproline dehydratase-like [Dendronephthya gigantea]|uniref:trans-L-3-hydroxyproline dehydratase-like n=1 Tax=Dendronephthya gigantea TaxID=151771 RepID=UPI00106C978F|nr:trans-L-3-hydroxyproline dehydratase-like [Dendronephthya gigantea]
MAGEAKRPKMEISKNGNLEITTVEMHTGGESLRIITSGYPQIKGETILAKRRYVAENFDNIRKLLMGEPRGHSEMYGALLVTPDNKKADLAVLFMHNGGYSVMCGHAVIALGRYAVDSGLVKVDPAGTSNVEVNIQCPCGLVKAMVEVTNGISGKVKFTSVPAFAFALDIKLSTKSFGEVSVDIGYGGTFYALVSDKELGLDIQNSSHSELVVAGKEMLQICRERIKVSHPEEDDLAFMYGVIITDGKDQFSDEPSRNVCFFGDGQIDRSPTGSGVTARIAVQYHKQQISLNQSREFVSIVGSKFTGSPIQETKCGNFPAVLVEVGGFANFCGKATFTLEKNDPFQEGFLIN